MAAKKPRGKPAAEEQMQCMYCEYKTDDFGLMSTHVKTVHPQPSAAAAPAATQQATETAAPSAPSAPSGFPSGGQSGGVRAPEKKNFLNFKSLAGFSYLLEAVIQSVVPANGNFGPCYDCRLDNGYTLSIKVDSQNHFDMFAKYGTNWTGKRIKITPGTTERGSARIMVTPLS